MNGVIIKKIDPVHSDERGIITDLLNGEIGHVGVITTKKGITRGNHYHKKSMQYSYTFSGKFEVLIANVNNTTKVEKIILNAGEMITIPPNTVHSFKALEDNTTMIDLISQSRAGDGYERDVIKGIILKY